MMWIEHYGGPCPRRAYGRVVEVQYNDGECEIGIAHNGVYWRYVSRYRFYSPIAQLTGSFGRANSSEGFVYA